MKKILKSPMRTVFFISTGRTGTDFFTYLFNNVIENSWSTHEPQPAFKRRGFQMVSREHTLYEKLYFRIPRKIRHSRHPEDWYVETNYHLFSCLDFLRDTFTDPLIVHLVRDGRDVVRSWLNRGYYLNDPGTRLTPSDFGSDSYEDEWVNFNALQKLSWYWRRVNELLLQQSPDLTIKFEDIFYREDSSIYNILSKLEEISFNREEVEATLSKKINPSQHKLIPKWPKWPESWKKMFLDIAAPTMKRFNYKVDEYN